MKSMRRRALLSSPSGFSYVEVLVVVVLLSIALVPMMQALNTTVANTSLVVAGRVDALALRSKLEEVLRQPFASLAAVAVTSGNPTVPSMFSDTITTSDNRQLARRVYLARYDGDNADGDNNPFTGTDLGLLYLRVEGNNPANRLEILTSQ